MIWLTLKTYKQDTHFLTFKCFCFLSLSLIFFYFIFLGKGRQDEEAMDQLLYTDDWFAWNIGFDTTPLGWLWRSSFVPKRKLCDLQENILQYWSSPKSSSIARVKQVEGQHLTSIYICNAFKDKGTVVCYFSDPFLHSISKKGLSDGIIHSLLADITGGCFLSFECLVIGEQTFAAQQRILE